MFFALLDTISLLTLAKKLEIPKKEVTISILVCRNCKLDFRSTLQSSILSVNVCESVERHAGICRSDIYRKGERKNV